MAYDEITYANKVENNGITPAGRFGADDLNEIKAVTNANGANFDGRIDVLEAGGGSPVGNPVSSSFVGDGATVSFVLTFTPTTGSSSAFVVGIDGVLQSPVDAYTVSTNTSEITFSSAPPVGSDIVVTTSSISSTDLSESTVVATGSTEDRKLTDRFADTVNVKDFGAVGDGVADDTAAIQAAVDVGTGLYWPAGTYLTTASISDLHTVRHSGEGAIKRGTDTWVVTPVRSTLRKLYISPTGNATNDGLSSNEPISTIQGAVDTISLNGTVVGRQQVIGAAGTYGGVVVIPEGLAVEDNYLEFKFPSDPTVRGDPSSWPVGGAIFDGTGYDGSNGWTVGAFNRVYIEYLLFKDWYDTGLGATSQVVSGLVCYEFTKVFLYGCSGTGNGYTNVTGIQNSDLTITGGIFDGARFCINNTGGNMSFSASASTKTTIKNGLEYGIYCKHESSTVMDYTEFLDNGNVAGAENYGAAIFCFKTNASVDTRSCDFQRNNHVYNLRGGFLSTHPSLLDTFGAGVDGNTRIWKINGYGSDDLINYRSIAGRDLVWNNGPASTSSVTIADILSTGVTIPAGYFTSADQYLEIDIWGKNNSASAAELRPTFRSTEPSNYGVGSFSINALSSFRVKLIIYPTAGATQFIQYDNVNTSVLIGNTTSIVKFDEFNETLYIRGSVPSSSLEVDKVRCVLWG